MTSYISNENPLPNICNICLKEERLGSIRNINLVIDPRIWNYQILCCGHIFCNDCYKKIIINQKYRYKCQVCKKNTKTYEWNFFDTRGEKYWFTLAEWFDNDNDKMLTDYDIKKIHNNALKCQINNGFWNLYSIIIKKSDNIIKERKRKKIQTYNKRKYDKKIYNSKITRKYNSLIKKYTRGWPPNKILSLIKKENIKKEAIAYVNNNGSYLCSTCNKNIQNRHKERHTYKCINK
jgi:hypothetical protein